MSQPIQFNEWHRWASSEKSRVASRRYREKKAGQRKIRARQKGLWIKKARQWS